MREIEIFDSERLAHILKDARLYDYFKYNYAQDDIWYIEYEDKLQRFIYRFNDFIAIFDNLASETLLKLYGKRKIDLHHLGDYDNE